MDYTTLLLGISAVITALTVIIMGLVKVYKFAKKIESAIGHDSSGRSLVDRVSRVEHQVFPNGGGSLSDQITELNKSVITVDTRTQLMESMLIAITGKNTNRTHNNTKRPSSSPGEPKISSAKTKPTNKKEVS